MSAPVFDSRVTLPCAMRLFGRTTDCGNSATLGIPSESGGLIPICEDCIAESDNQRRFLKPLGAQP